MSTQITNHLPLIPMFQKFVSLSSSGRRITHSGKRICKGSIIQYNCVLKLLEQFEKHQVAPLRIRQLDRSSKRVMQSEKLYWKRFFKNFTEWLYKKKCFDIYVNAIAKTLRTFFNYLSNDLFYIIGNFHQQFKVPQQKITPIVLEPEQLKFLITNIEFKNALSKTLQRTNDIFVFGCTVGLRFSDLMKLKKTDLQFTNTNAFVLLNTAKNATHVKIPLPQYAVEIINKYKYKTGKYVLPRLSNTNLNLQLKQLIEKAGWVYNLPKIRYQQGNPKELKNKQGKNYRFCDHITAHTMRRTAITTLLLMGVEENMVRTISGHSAGSKEFYKYVAVVQNYLNTQVINAYEKLLNIA